MEYNEFFVYYLCIHRESLQNRPDDKLGMQMSFQQLRDINNHHKCHLDSYETNVP